jgi:hypothetical protein
VKKNENRKEQSAENKEQVRRNNASKTAEIKIGYFWKIQG